MVEFFKDFIAESKRIVWPSRSELVSKTVSVIIFSLLIAGIVFVFDFGFSNVLKLLRDLVL